MAPIYVHWTAPDGTTHLAGRLTNIGSAGLQRFSYEPTWLTGPGFALGEGLSAVSGSFLPPGGATEFGVFLDAAPDAWGRRVLSRKRTGHLRTGTDFLLAAADETRQGALRFALDEDGPFLADGGPEPIARLHDLAREIIDFQEDKETPGGFARLLRAGTSQGGFRPKATVIDDDGALWMAKFPSETDTYDVETCEAAALHIAREARLTVPEFTHIRVDPDRAILLIKRFDRTAKGRLGYQSMRSASRLGANDALDYRTAAATAGYYSGSRGVEAIVGLAALNIAVNNIDDHSRNAGFIQDAMGQWQPAPLFDIVPYPRQGEGTPLSPSTPDRSVDAMLDLNWGISPKTVEETVHRVATAATQLYAVAIQHYGMDPEAAENAERYRPVAAR